MDAQPHAGNRLSARFGDFFSAFLAIKQAFAAGNISASPFNLVVDAVLNLLVYRAVAGPSDCHESSFFIYYRKSGAYFQVSSMRKPGHRFVIFHLNKTALLFQYFVFTEVCGAAGYQIDDFLTAVIIDMGFHRADDADAECGDFRSDVNRNIGNQRTHSGINIFVGKILWYGIA